MKAAHGQTIEPTDLQCNESTYRKSNDVDLISFGQSGNVIRESLKIAQSINGRINGKSVLTNHPKSISPRVLMNHLCLGDGTGSTMKVDDGSAVRVTE
jgi:hypothetical protein